MSLDFFSYFVDRFLCLLGLSSLGIQLRGCVPRPAQRPSRKNELVYIYLYFLMLLHILPLFAEFVVSVTSVAHLVLLWPCFWNHEILYSLFHLIETNLIMVTWCDLPYGAFILRRLESEIIYLIEIAFDGDSWNFLQTDCKGIDKQARGVPFFRAPTCVFFLSDRCHGARGALGQGRSGSLLQVSIGDC